MSLFNQEIEALADGVMQGGFSWVTDGPKIREIIQKVNLETKGKVRELTARKDLIAGVLDTLDQLHGWDAPRMDEAQERVFYRFLIEMEVKK